MVIYYPHIGDNANVDEIIKQFDEKAVHVNSGKEKASVEKQFHFGVAAYYLLDLVYFLRGEINEDAKNGEIKEFFKQYYPMMAKKADKVFSMLLAFEVAVTITILGGILIHLKGD